MRHRLIIAALLIATPAFAQDIESMTLADKLGSVIASEEFCGLTYDQAAIAAFIESNVAADDMGFPSMLSTMVQGHIYQQAAMTPSSKTAHCAQVARVAKTNHFID